MPLRLRGHNKLPWPLDAQRRARHRLLDRQGRGPQGLQPPVLGRLVQPLQRPRMEGHKCQRRATSAPRALLSLAEAHQGQWGT